MQFGDNYLNDGHLPPEIPQIDGRDSFNSVSHRSLAVSFEMPNWSSRRAIRQGRRADGHGGLRQRCADASACGRRSARILEIHGLTWTASSRKLADAN